MKTLVVYFSAESGRTAREAQKLASAADADIFEIQPQKPYSSSDLNYMNPFSRCNREHITKKEVPVNGTIENFDSYDTILIGFPIWYGCAPNVVNTFCKGYSWNGKNVALFATSGGSGMGKTVEKLMPYITGANVVDAKLVNGMDSEELNAWVKNLS